MPISSKTAAKGCQLKVYKSFCLSFFFDCKRLRVTWNILIKSLPKCRSKRSLKRSRFLRSRSLILRSAIATRSFGKMAIADRDPIAKKWSGIAIGDLLIGDHSCSDSDQQKHESSCLLRDCLSCISPEALELQNSYFHLFASSSEELSDEKRIFQIRSKYQVIFAKTLFFQKKSKLLEKIGHFEKFKNFFSWSKGLGIKLTY